MDVDAFVKELAEAGPSVSELERCGLRGEQAHEFIKSFVGIRRRTPLPNVSDLGSLQDLRNWDLSKVQIGMLRFSDPPSSRSGSVHIGCVEVDPLVVLSNSEEIVVQELDIPEHILWFVARNGASMLDALVVAARFLGKRAVETIEFDDYEAAQSVAWQCSSAAGGEKYLNFYTMLLGAEP